MSAPFNEADALEGVARLLARLLLSELDESTLERLAAPRVAEALAAVGVDVPVGLDGDERDELAAAYCDAFLQPQRGGAPPIASLWVDGEYEGDTTRAVRALAASAALEFDAEPARGVPPDHIGALLLLWAESRDRAPAVAARIVANHLAWVERALGPLAAAAEAGHGGFYGQVARATIEFVAELRRAGDVVDAPPPPPQGP